ncbi:MAG: GrdB-related putative oxidoreductase [Leptotrichiaceae bacterium]|nr:GrdB-related putative oxidoreductase [Leptotrichiaceae bacterium]
MRVVLFFDQIQSGTGGKENANVELAVEKGGIGSYMMFEEYMKEIGASVLATTYCSDSYFRENRETVLSKMESLLNKVKANILLCGPCFNYYGYAQMSAVLAEYIGQNTECIPVVVCSEENGDIIEKYKNKITIVKMPKKGGVGLRESLKNMSKVIKVIYNKEDRASISDYIY